MDNINTIKHRLIERILATNNDLLLEAIDKIFQSVQSENSRTLTEEQRDMLLMSDKDIQNGGLISESELEKSDEQWLD